jgi:hypothetical protein
MGGEVGRSWGEGKHSQNILFGKKKSIFRNKTKKSMCNHAWLLVHTFLSDICRWAEKLDRLTSTATKDPEGFVGHPVNAFKLMKRLNTEWSELENLILKDMSDGECKGAGGRKADSGPKCIPCL